MPKWKKLILAVISLLGLFCISFLIDREQHFFLIGTYSVLFLVYIFQLRNLDSYRTHEIFNLAIILRLVFLLSFPSLSDDFYRFIWDGRLLGAGENPFEFLPAEFLKAGVASNITPELYYRLNSPQYFTVYPPIAQFVFLISTSLFPGDVYGSVIVMKAFAFLAECGLLIVMMRLLRRMNLSMRFIAVYALNPLVIIEVMGNLHHEGMMVFFLVLAIYLLIKSKYTGSALMWGMAIGTKLLPLMFLPLLLKKLATKRLVIYYVTVLTVIVILFAPLIEGLIIGMRESLTLYFQKFEFNASLYYIIREVGYLFYGYNIIQTAGPILGMLVFFLITIYSLYFFKNDELFNGLTWVFVIYLLLATTVHPWYIISLICFSVFTGYIFPLVWSFFIFLTYAGYSVNGYDEVSWIVIVEYIVAFIVMIYELKSKTPLIHRFSKVDLQFKSIVT